MIRIQGTKFVDREGRTRLLRGVNLGGSSKIPSRPQVDLFDPRFYNERDVSFVGRPFPLDQADEHFTRLREWGLSFLRLVVTWEAIAHAGPGEYDTEYLDYLCAVVQKAGEMGFEVLIDPHQDVWSRFTGGSGAPGWTLEAIGFDLKHMTPTGAAMLYDWRGRRPPLLIWGTNYARLAPATMFTLFFAGSDFAPETKVDGIPVQEFLQQHYIAAFQQVARRLSHIPCVVGYEVINEPSRGYIGWKNLRSSGQFRYWPTPSPYQGMLLGAGFSQRVWHKRVNPAGMRVWRPGCECIWKQNGVWDVNQRGEPQLLRPTHFHDAHGHPAEFRRDYYPPFARRFAQSIQQVDPRALIFVQGEPGERPPILHATEIPNMAYAPHWYDGIPLLIRRYWNHLGTDFLRRRLVLGAAAIARSFNGQLAVYHHDAEHDMGGVPVFLGEFGIPFDLHNRPLMRGADEFLTSRALDRSFRALESTGMSGTLWNYSPDNTHERGDSFNGEDMSVFSRTEQTNPAEINSGGRALAALVRPYPRAIAGELLQLHYDWQTKVFKFEFRHDVQVRAPTEVFVPQLPYPQGLVVEVSDGTYELCEREHCLIYHHDPQQPTHQLTIKPA